MSTKRDVKGRKGGPNLIDDPRPLQQVGSDVGSNDLVPDAELDFNVLAKSGTIVVSDGLGVSKRLHNGIRGHDLKWVDEKYHVKLGLNGYLKISPTCSSTSLILEASLSTVAKYLITYLVLHGREVGVRGDGNGLSNSLENLTSQSFQPRFHL